MTESMPPPLPHPQGKTLPPLEKKMDQVVCRIDPHPVDVYVLRSSLPDLGHTGGYVCFEGLVRNINHGRNVLRLEYEAFESLALKEMYHIAFHAIDHFGLEWVRIVHRVGSLQIGDTAVIIQVLARHRREAFEGCHYVIDQIKVRVPIWKREIYDDGSAAWTRCHNHEATAPLTLEGD